MSDPTAPQSGAATERTLGDILLLFAEEPAVGVTPVTMAGAPAEALDLALEVQPGFVVHLVGEEATLASWVAAIGAAWDRWSGR